MSNDLTDSRNWKGEKDAEIARLNAKLEKAGLIIAQCGLDWIEVKKLIGELADELERFHCYSEYMDLSIFLDCSLIQRAREAIE